MESIFIIVFRLILPAIFAVGAVLLAKEKKEGWGWCIFAAIVLGSMSIKFGTLAA